MFITPKQLGPTSLILYFLHSSTNSFSSLAPSSSISLNPAEITTIFLIPISPHSSTVAGIKCEGMVITARSTGPCSLIDVQAGIPSISPPLILTGTISPL